MFRTLAGSVLLAFASAASAQMFYLPPPQVQAYNPYWPNLSGNAIARLRVLSPPWSYWPAGQGPWMQANGAGQAAAGPQFTGATDQWGNPYVVGNLPVELGVEPQTGDPLYFRKADLMPPPANTQDAPSTRPESAGPARPLRLAPPTTRPSGDYPPGTIIIKMHNPQGAGQFVSR